MYLFLPQDGLEVPRIPYIAARPTRRKPTFDYEAFFAIMMTIEEGNILYDQLPPIEGVVGVRDSKEVLSLIIENGKLTNEILQQIGGIPVRLMQHNQSGVVTEFKGIEAGKWISEFRSAASCSEGLVQLSAQELQEGYLATIPRD